MLAVGRISVSRGVGAVVWRIATTLNREEDRESRS